MGLLFQLMIRGLIAGSVYALLGISWGIIYNATRTFHFAHGFIYAIGVYTVVLLTMEVQVPFALSFAIGLAVACLFGCLCEILAYRPLREKGGTQLGIFLTAMGIMILGENMILILFGPNPRPLKVFEEIPFSWGPISLTTLELITVFASWTMIIITLALLRYTKMGKIIRAVSNNPERAISVGIDVQKIYIVIFCIGSFLMAWAGVFSTMNTAATPYAGIPALLMAFMAVFLGGVGSIKGAILGGVLIGLTESLSLIFIAAQYKLIITFLMLFLVILIKPEGISSIFRNEEK